MDGKIGEGVSRTLGVGALAFVTTLILLSLLSMEHVVIVSSVGASIFIVLTMPTSETARNRSIIGGHLIGLVTGAICSTLPGFIYVSPLVGCALAVGLSTMGMMATNTIHPPAAGTALYVALEGGSLNVVSAILTSVTLLALVHQLIGRRLR